MRVNDQRRPLHTTILAVRPICHTSTAIVDNSPCKRDQGQTTVFNRALEQANVEGFGNGFESFIQSSNFRTLLNIPTPNSVIDCGSHWGLGRAPAKIESIVF